MCNIICQMRPGINCSSFSVVPNSNSTNAINNGNSTKTEAECLILDQDKLEILNSTNTTELYVEAFIKYEPVKLVPSANATNTTTE